MSKMVNSEARSPFVDRMFNLLPQGHEEALTNAFYNVAVVCFLVAGGGAAMAVYFILQPFLKPLLWAILVGSVLHPLKHKVIRLPKCQCYLSPPSSNQQRDSRMKERKKNLGLNMSPACPYCMTFSFQDL